MNFSRHNDIDAFQQEVREFFAPFCTPERRALEEERHAHHDPELYRALGQRGWVMPEWPRERGGAGLSHEQAAVLELEHIRLELPRINLYTSRLVISAVDQFAQEPVRSTVIAEVVAGQSVLVLGFTETESGSDIASAKTRAVRDGDDWVINGQKMFTTGAQHPGYVFLLTRTDPNARKHAGLTTFLVPLDHAGVEVQPIPTLGERSNMVYFSDVRIPDCYRMGEPGDGWTVLLGPLSEEHGISDQRGLTDVGLLYSRHLANAFNAAQHWAHTPDAMGHRPIESARVRDILAEVAVDLAAYSSTWGTTGRVGAADALQRGINELVQLIGVEALISGMAGDPRPAGTLENIRRATRVCKIYGGTVEVFRQMIAEQLGLPRPRFPQ